MRLESLQGSRLNACQVSVRSGTRVLRFRLRPRPAPLPSVELRVSSVVNPLLQCQLAGK